MDVLEIVWYFDTVTHLAHPFRVPAHQLNRSIVSDDREYVDPGTVLLRQRERKEERLPGLEVPSADAQDVLDILVQSLGLQDDQVARRLFHDPVQVPAQDRPSAAT